MAFGIKRDELRKWKTMLTKGEVVFLTHFWLDSRFPDCNTVTKVGCSDLEKLTEWGKKYELDPKWIHLDPRYPHFDLFGETQKKILMEEGQWDQIKRFNL